MMYSEVIVAKIIIKKLFLFCFHLQNIVNTQRRLMMQPNLKSFQEERRRWGDLEQQPLSYSLKRARKGLGSGGGGG